MMDFHWYTSIGGIILATGVVVQAIKRFLGNTAPFASVPTWMYSVFVASVLSATSKYFGLLQSEGTWLEVLMQVAMTAGATSGFVSWLQNMTVPVEDSAMAKKAAAESRIRAAVVLLAVGVGLSGTACAARGANATPPERTLATYGRQVIAVSRTIVKSVDLLTQQRLATIASELSAKQIDAKTAHDRSEKVRSDARAAAGILENIGNGGMQLAQALTIVDTATNDEERLRGIQSAQSVVAMIQTMIKTGVIELRDDSTRNAVTTLLTQVLDILAALQPLLPSTAPAPATPPELDPTPDLELDPRPLLERANYQHGIGYQPDNRCFFTVVQGIVIDASPGCRQAVPEDRRLAA